MTRCSMDASTWIQPHVKIAGRLSWLAAAGLEDGAWVHASLMAPPFSLSSAHASGCSHITKGSGRLSRLTAARLETEYGYKLCSPPIRQSYEGTLTNKYPMIGSLQLVACLAFKTVWWALPMPCANTKHESGFYEFDWFAILSLVYPKILMWTTLPVLSWDYEGLKGRNTRGPVVFPKSPKLS